MSDGWKEVATSEQLEKFLHEVGDFHDGILKEVHFVNRSHVDDSLAMLPTQLADVRMLVQRQWKDPSAVELVFEDVLTLSLDTLGFIYGCDLSWASDDEEKDPITWLTLHLEKSQITFKRMRWRDASEWMGTDVRFGDTFVS